MLAHPMMRRDPPGWSLRSVLAAMSVASLFACGGEVLSDVTHDGAAADARAPRDASKPRDVGRATFDVSLSPPDASSERSANSDSGLLDVESFDVGDVSIPVPDSAPFDGCTPDPCVTGQACWTNGSRAGCVGVPPICEGGSTCSCVLAAASWCLMGSCKNDAGEIVLACVPTKKGPPPR